LEKKLNENICLHGIGNSLCMIYLKTLHELKEAISAGIITDVPFYTKDLLRPLSPFRHFTNGQYAYFVKIVDNHTMVDFVTNKGEAYDQVNEYGVHKYKLCHYDISSGRNEWCGSVNIIPRNIDTTQLQSNVKDYMERRMFNDAEVFFLPDYNCPSSVRTIRRQDLNIMINACDIFCKDRIEHFTIFARYTIDFANMLDKLYQNGLDSLKIWIQ
jgi:hypothetical protein